MIPRRCSSSRLGEDEEAFNFRLTCYHLREITASALAFTRPPPLELRRNITARFKRGRKFSHGIC